MHTCLRNNLRQMHGAGMSRNPSADLSLSLSLASLSDPLRVSLSLGTGKDQLIFDCLMAWFCGPCSFCQELRSVDPATWDWLSEIKGKGVKPMVQPIKCFRE